MPTFLQSDTERSPLVLVSFLEIVGVIPDSAAIYAYLGVLVTLLAAGFGLPIPEEIAIVTAGALAGHAASDPSSRIVWWIMLPTCILGVVASDSCLYIIGRVWGQRLLKSSWVQRRLIPPAKRESIERNFRQYGFWILLGARLLPGIRSPIFIMAGVNRLSLTKFIIADGIYAIPGVSLLFFLSYLFTDQFVEVVRKAESVRPIVVMCVIAVMVGAGIYYFLKHPVATGDPHEVPLIGNQLAHRIESHHPDGQPKTDNPAKALDSGIRPNTPP
jgi:membrane protein DedA with SNARE-associated domain